jgi:hypothetical protein
MLGGVRVYASGNTAILKHLGVFISTERKHVKAALRVPSRKVGLR